MSWFPKAFSILRYIIIIAFAGWAGAAAAIGKWLWMLFFIAFMLFLWFTRKVGDKHIVDMFSDDDKQ